MFQMLQIVINPPLSYVFALLIGLLIGGGVQLIYSGILGIHTRRFIRVNREYWMRFWAIAAFIAFAFGTLFTVTGSILFIMLIINMFIEKSQFLSFLINIFLSVIVFAILVAPVFLIRRKNKI